MHRSRQANRQLADEALLRARIAGSMVVTDRTRVLWDPLKPSSGNRVKTWNPEIMNAVAGSMAPIDIISSVVAFSPNVVPAGVWDLRYARLHALFSDPGTAGDFNLAEGAVLANIGAIENGAQIVGNSNTPGHDAIRFDWATRPDPWLRMNGSIFNFGTEPMIQVPDGRVLILEPVGSFSWLGSDTPGPIVHLNGTATVALYTNSMPNSSLSNNWATGTGSIDYENDGTLPSPLPTLPGFAGTISNNITQCGGGSGPTSDRPFPYYGDTFRFNETTGKPMFWNPISSQWVYADGSSA